MEVEDSVVVLEVMELITRKDDKTVKIVQFDRCHV
jgi:hypothetical protein